jgi:hypothetical protein
VIPDPQARIITEAEQERFVSVASEYARRNGYKVADCCDLFEHHDGTVVVHLNKPVQTDPTGRYTYVDTPSTVCVMINRHTGNCSIPEML